jgi:hypothetical protein
VAGFYSPGNGPDKKLSARKSHRLLLKREFQMARKAAGRRKSSKAAQSTVASAMRRRKSGTLRSGKSGHGGRVTSRKQAIAIGLSEARKKGQKVAPRRKRAS